MFLIDVRCFFKLEFVRDGRAKDIAEASAHPEPSAHTIK
jgi:hypothetical protein